MSTALESANFKVASLIKTQKYHFWIRCHLVISHDVSSRLASKVGKKRMFGQNGDGCTRTLW